MKAGRQIIGSAFGSQMRQMMRYVDERGWNGRPLAAKQVRGGVVPSSEIQEESVNEAYIKYP